MPLETGKPVAVRLPWLLSVRAVLAVLAALASAHGQAARIPMIAGEPIAQAEWDLFQEPERAAVFNRFHQLYHAEDSPDFWTRDFGGGKPVDMLRERARHNLERIKVEQKLARKAGLIQDISWKGFVRDFNKENRRRSQALRSGQVVYGPKVMDAREYFDYRHSNMVIRLKEDLAHQGLEPPESRVRHMYDSLKSSRFADLPYAEVRAVLRQQLLDTAYEAKVDKLLRADLAMRD